MPPKPDYFRVKVGRLLARAGAAALKNSVYVLPPTDRARAECEAIVREIVEGGGEAVLCRASFLEGISDADVERRLEAKAAGAPAADRPRGRTWVTREGIFVDRIASAWLIRRFIDPDARFRFVPARGHRREPGEIRFDMPGAEYTHEGDRCTFETLVRRFGLDDPALEEIAEIVHDIDLGDGKFEREEAPGIRRVLAGIAASHPGDAARLARGSQMLDELYALLRSERGA